MKKLIFAGVLALATLTACQNETSQTEEIQTLKIKKAGNAAVEFMKIQMQKSTSRGDIDTGPTEPTDTVIHCHTDWTYESGNSCITSGGYLFNVKWQTTYEYVSPGNWKEVTIYYPGQPVSSCSC